MAIINPDEITSIIKEKLQNYDSKVEVKNVGISKDFNCSIFSLLIISIVFGK